MYINSKYIHLNNEGLENFKIKPHERHEHFHKGNETKKLPKGV